MVRVSNFGEYEPYWKGLETGYRAKHNWLSKTYGRPRYCHHCLKKGELINKKWNIQWANRDKLYSRDIKDYLPLCIKCHRQYDKKDSCIRGHSLLDEKNVYHTNTKGRSWRRCKTCRRERERVRRFNIRNSTNLKYE